MISDDLMLLYWCFHSIISHGSHSRQRWMTDHIFTPFSQSQNVSRTTIAVFLCLFCFFPHRGRAACWVSTRTRRISALSIHKGHKKKGCLSPLPPKKNPTLALWKVIKMHVSYSSGTDTYTAACISDNTNHGSTAPSGEIADGSVRPSNTCATTKMSVCRLHMLAQAGPRPRRGWGCVCGVAGQRERGLVGGEAFVWQQRSLLSERWQIRTNTGKIGPEREGGQCTPSRL